MAASDKLKNNQNINVGRQVYKRIALTTFQLNYILSIIYGQIPIIISTISGCYCFICGFLLIFI